MSTRPYNSFLAQMPSVTKNIVIINALIYLATLVLRRINIDLVELLGLHYFSAEGFRFFQPITYLFMHSPQGISHIFFNMFAVVVFGSTLERVWGAKRFLLYYLFTGIGAGVTQELVWYLTLRQGMYEGYPLIQEYLVTIGASGAVFGVLLAFGVIFPNLPLYIMFIPIPIKAKWVVIGYGLIELFAGISNRAGDNVAHFAHLGGMLFGLILILWWRKKYGKEQYY